MTIGAVICEYNPFHNGHKYQLEKIRERLNLDYIICIMSGDFTQRGEPAIFSKEKRAEWALENGADLVLLLPLPFATGSADLFAHGAISILNRLGCVDYLCFGSECGDIDTLYFCAEKLLSEGQVGSDGIRALMKEGKTFAKSRYLLFPEFEAILAHPNNVLALEYIMSLIRSQSKIKPYTLIREGEDYDNDEIIENAKYLSASAIRKAILAGNACKITDYVPYDLAKITDKPICSDDFSGELYYALLTNIEYLSEYLEASADLTNRIESMLYEYSNFSSFVETLKSKNFTHSRISRTLLHTLLDLQGSSTFYKECAKHLTHVRVLGFRQSAGALLAEIAAKTSITMITKVPSVYDSLNKEMKRMLDAEVFASTLYDRHNESHIHEYAKAIVIK